jgi:hypothetical protein
MANLAAKTVSGAGVSVPITTTPAGGGDAFDNDGRTIFIAKTAGTVITLTFDSLVPSNYGTDVNYVVATPATGNTFIGPFDPSRFNDANGRVGVTYSAVTGLTVDVVRF